MAGTVSVPCRREYYTIFRPQLSRRKAVMQQSVDFGSISKYDYGADEIAFAMLLCRRGKDNERDDLCVEDVRQKRQAKAAALTSVYQ